MIDYISYNGQKYPIRFSYFALMMAGKEGKDADDLESHQNLLFYALQAGHKLAGQPMTLRKEDMVWILDESYIEFQKLILKYTKELGDAQEEIIAGKKKSK